TLNTRQKHEHGSQQQKNVPLALALARVDLGPGRPARPGAAGVHPGGAGPGGAGPGGAGPGRVRARPASTPAESCTTVAASNATTGTSQPPVAVCRNPMASGPPVAIRYPTLWANPDREADATGSGARATVKKMASPSEAPWPRPSSRVQTNAVLTGASSAPVSPTALASPATRTSGRWSRARWASTGMSMAVTALPKFISASRAPACSGLTPRSRNRVGSQDSAA